MRLSAYASAAMLAALAAVVTACGSSETTTAPATTTTAAPSSASSTTAPAATATTTEAAAPISDLRAQTCRDMLPVLDVLREADPAAATQSAETTIANLKNTPEWSTLSEADRAATVAGIRDAAAGAC